jgi:hypothetical protein
MTDQEILGRLVRIETRLSKLMAFFGLNPATGEPTNQRKDTDAQSKKNTPTYDSQRRPDRR